MANSRELEIIKDVLAKHKGRENLASIPGASTPKGPIVPFFPSLLKLVDYVEALEKRVAKLEEGQKYT